MGEFDFQRRFEQVGAYTAWITAIALAIALSFDQYKTNHPMTPWLYWVLMASTVFVGLGYTVQLIIGRKTGSKQMGMVQGTVQIAVSTIALTGLCAATGGIEQPYWLFYIVALIPAAVSLPVSFTILAGIAASGGVILASFVAGTLKTENVGALVFVCALIPVTAWYSGVLTDALRRVMERAEHNRAQLGDGVTHLSNVMAQAAEGYLAVDNSISHEALDDEALSALSSAFNDTLESLRSLVTQIRSGGEQIAASAGELLATAEEHAASATQQSSAVSETTSTIE
ncbi:MAG: methyl-accepting chemotaxis protein, partial [Frankiales bacterium]|nr:methyl-accepting chemotaxis protein [Frankiales bacterium]